MVLLSFLLPTRNRLAMLKESIQSVFDLAQDPANVEILVGLDNDDPSLGETIDYLQSHPHADKLKHAVYERYGYKKLHLYVNDLCSHAKGRYFLLWNDDAKMVSTHYDTLFKDLFETQDKLYVYQPRNNHYENIFPAIPREWYDLTGHFSMNAHNDSWVNELANTLQVNRKCEIVAWHLRGVDPKNNIYCEVDADIKVSCPEYQSAENCEIRRKDIALLRERLYPA